MIMSTTNTSNIHNGNIMTVSTLEKLSAGIDRIKEVPKIYLGKYGEKCLD